MKKIFSIAFCLMMMTLCSMGVYAQNECNGKQKVNREKLAERQAAHIAKELALDDATSQKFVKTYCENQKEVWALNVHKKGSKKGNVTEAEAEQDLKARMERSEKILAIREKYYKEYSAFLTQKQIQKVYELEKQMMRKLSKRGKAHHRSYKKRR